MINFVTAKTEDSANLIRIRSLVKTVTTVVLVLYIVAVAGFLGWWAYVSSKTVRVSDEVEDLSRRIAAKSEEEVTVRKLDGRVRAVQDFINGRSEKGADADVLARAEFVPVGWDYDVYLGRQSVAVNTPDVAGIETFIKFMTDEFGMVRLESADWKAESGWVGSVSFKDIKTK